MNKEVKANRKVFVVLSRMHTKIWKDDFEPGSAPENMAEEHVNGDYKRMLDKYLSGRKRSKLDPIFAERVAKELDGFGRIFLAGGGKGKASAVDNFATYLKTHHRLIADKIHAIEDVDASNMCDGELLAVARKMVEKDLL
jgi:hypothetical protein